MSPQVVLRQKEIECFPRVSGDEPAADAERQIMNLFSPCERG